ncbi:MAG: type I methionyl aminopeptidase [Phycisphaerales bacterium]|nr:MAG: type I methionyl aminopeptidase [Phycisphaerales bacterium]
MQRVPTVQGVDAELAFEAAQRVVETHKRLSGFLRAGQTLAEIDRFVAETLQELRCKSCFLGYRTGGLPPFPSYACLSVNDCVVHGTAGYRLEPLGEGDLLKIDIGVSYKGWIGDAAWTYSIGEPSDEVRRLMACGKRSIELGVETLRAGAPLMDWARTVQRHVEDECGFHLVRGLGGHGYGRSLHAPPFLSNTVPTFPGEWADAGRRWEAGTLIAVEPMIAVGTGEVRQQRKQWPIWSADGSMTVHYEHDVLVTEEGPRVLTGGLESVEDVILR